MKALADRIIASDQANARPAIAREFGADVTIDNAVEDAAARVLEVTGGVGADVAVEAVGVPETFELCMEVIRPGGRVAMSACTAIRRRSISRRCGSATSR
jgi:alcohol dehydrogenase